MVSATSAIRRCFSSTILVVHAIATNVVVFFFRFSAKMAVSDVSQKYDVSHKGGYAQINLQYKPHKRATKLIVTILTDINACNNNISINNKREGLITSCLGG